MTLEHIHRDIAIYGLMIFAFVTVWSVIICSKIDKLAARKAEESSSGGRK